MYIGAGIFLIAIGVLLAMFLSSTLGIIFIVLGVLAILLSFIGVGPFASTRREVIVERDRRPVTTERETVREREVP